MFWKPQGIWTAQRILCSAPSCHYQWHAELITLCDHLMWHWPLTWLVACLPPSPRVYLSGRYRRRPAVNSVGPHCYVIAAGSTVTHVKEVENEDLIYSTTSVATPLSPFLFLPEINLLLNLSLHRGACSGHLPHEGASDGFRDKAAIWQRNSDFKKLKDDSRGLIGMRELLRQCVRKANLI